MEILLDRMKLDMVVALTILSLKESLKETWEELGRKTW